VNFHFISQSTETVILMC